MFRLALALGRTVWELECSLGCDELVEWMAYATLEPWGYDIENYRAGLAAAMIVNQSRTKKDDPVTLPLHFFRQEAEERKETPEEIARNIKTKVFGIRE